MALAGLRPKLRQSAKRSAEVVKFFRQIERKRLKCLQSWQTLQLLQRQIAPWNPTDSHERAGHPKRRNILMQNFPTMNRPKLRNRVESAPCKMRNAIAPSLAALKTPKK